MDILIAVARRIVAKLLEFASFAPGPLPAPTVSSALEEQRRNSAPFAPQIGVEPELA